LELREIDIPQGEDTESLEQCPGLVLQRERESRLVGHPEPRRITRDEDEARDVVGKVLDAGAHDLEAERLGGARRRDGRGIGELLIANELGAPRRIVGGDDLDTDTAEELLAL